MTVDAGMPVRDVVVGTINSQNVEFAEASVEFEKQMKESADKKKMELEEFDRTRLESCEVQLAPDAAWGRNYEKETEHVHSQLREMHARRPPQKAHSYVRLDYQSAKVVKVKTAYFDAIIDKEISLRTQFRNESKLRGDAFQYLSGIVKSHGVRECDRVAVERALICIQFAEIYERFVLAVCIDSRRPKISSNGWFRFGRRQWYTAKTHTESEVLQQIFDILTEIDPCGEERNRIRKAFQRTLVNLDILAAYKEALEEELCDGIADLHLYRQYVKKQEDVWRNFLQLKDRSWAPKRWVDLQWGESFWDEQAR